MDYFQKYLDLVNKKNFVGGAIPVEEKRKFRNEGDWMHYPLSWNLQHKEFYRWPLILKLVKLPPDTIQKIIGDKDMYTNFLNCILVSVGSVPTVQNTPGQKPLDIKRILSEYPSEYSKYLTSYYENLSLTQKDVIYVKNLIDYFLETHKKIKDLLTNNSQQDEENAKKIETQLNMCRDYYYEWRQHINIFYGLFRFNGLTPRDGEDKGKYVEPSNSKSKSDDSKSCFKVIYSKKLEINKAYKELYEKSIVSYLKIRRDANQTGYNQRFNVFLEPVDDRLKQPQSMYLTGPDPNNMISLYAKNAKYKHISDEGVAGSRNSDGKIVGEYPNLILGPNAKNPATPEDSELAFVSKYDYGYLYGPFSRIFPPQVLNPQIGKECIEIIDKIEANESVFVLGYGASGSGKTSSLIFNKNGNTTDEKEGVLLQILKSEKFQKYTDITVSVHELYSTNISGKKESREYNDIKFTRRKDGSFYISDDMNSIEGEYTENVRTRLGPLEVKRREDEITKKYSMETDPTDNKIQDPKYPDDPTKQVLVNKTNEKSRFYSSYKTAIKNVQDIVWNTSIYKWQITRNQDGTFFSGKNSIEENIKNLTQKRKDVANGTKEQENYDVLLNEFNEKKRNNIGIYDPRIMCEPKECANEADVGKESIKVNELGKLLLLLVDRIRMVNPTTNNDNSSRSHVLIYVKLPYIDSSGQIDLTKHKYLIFGDLAGVENKFTCENKTTQSAFLKLEVLNRITGKKLGETDKSQIGVPHYTVNTKLKFSLLPLDSKAMAYYDFIGYDSKNVDLLETQEYQTRRAMLTHLSGAFSQVPNGKYPEYLKKEFPANNEEKKYKTEYVYKYEYIQNYLKENGLEDATTVNASMPGLVIKNLYQIALNKTPNLFPTAGPSDIELGKFEQSTGAKDRFKEYLAWREDTKPKTGDQWNPETAAKEVKRENLSDFEQTVDNKVVKEGISAGFIDYLRKYYAKKYENEDVFKKGYVEYPNNVNDYYAGKFEGNLHNGAGLINKIETNLLLLKETGVEELCGERMKEGIFINNALMGMSKNISDIVQKLNSGSGGDPGLLKNIPLVKEPCFKYYCSQDHESCFSQVKKETNDLNNDSSIVDDIRKMIDTKDSSENTNKLGIVIFAVLNLNKNANDPVSLPYIDLNRLKEIRNDYITYKFYNQENDRDIRKNQIEAIKNIFADGRKSISSVLTSFRGNIGEVLYQKPHDIYNKIIDKYETEINPYFFKNLLELIDTIDILNSLTVIGTMNFLNTVKNIYSTDNTCNLINNDSGKPDAGTEPIENYINVINTKETLSTVMTDQRKFNESGILSTSNYEFNGPKIEPSKINEVVKDALVSSESSTSSKVSPPKTSPPKTSPPKTSPPKTSPPKTSLKKGGNMTERDSLQYEYKRLKKMYKQMKNQ
jgi:hypothetical protein